MENLPKPLAMSKEEFVALLHDILSRVEQEDSFEGAITYSMPIADGEPPSDWGEWPDENADFWVTATYRIGNTYGQGGMRIISG